MTGTDDQIFVLHRRPYRNTSLLLDCFSQQQGRINFVANQVQRNNHLPASILQPFQLLRISYTGKRDLKTLQSAEQISVTRLVDKKLFCGLYLNELLYHLLSLFDPYPELFIAYQECIQTLEISEALAATLRGFELALLEALGYGIDLCNDSQGNSIVEENYYRFIPQQGFMTTNAANASAFPGSHLLLMAENNFSNTMTESIARQITSKLLEGLLGNKQLNSRELYRQYLASSKLRHCEE